jgi:hypothetical protein
MIREQEAEARGYARCQADAVALCDCEAKREEQEPRVRATFAEWWDAAQRMFQNDAHIGAAERAKRERE